MAGMPWSTEERPGTWIALVLALVVMAGGCRDASDFVAPDDRVLRTALPRQLTFGNRDQRSPRWHPSGDSVVFHEPGIQPFRPHEGLILIMDVHGGPARPLIPAVQGDFRGPLQRFGHAALAPDGRRVAWIDFVGIRPEFLCRGQVSLCSPPDVSRSIPPLGTLVLRARDRTSVAPLGSGAAASIEVGRARFVSDVTADPLDGFFEIELPPHQQRWLSERSPVTRPSWSPDGARVVASRGEALVILDAASGAAREVPGIRDFVHADWSPTGDRIAGTLYRRGEAVRGQCFYLIFGEKVCADRRVVWPIEGEHVAVVRPDGSGLRELWRGAEPAWMPDGRIVFRFDDRLWMGDPDSDGEPREILGTRGAREPAVSPDGTRILFVRETAQGFHNLFLLELDVAPGLDPLGGAAP